ncbi:MAG: ATP-dependent 6-phosphofructokinase [Planctomycetia bacterium]|nr:ATP-dependent 6-phosphofructokinase [Planctomycetia bacterium]
MRVGVLCSGGDAPGMNACIRAIVRSGINAGLDIVGIMRGYQGILEEDFFQTERSVPLMALRSVSDIARMGGTVLGSSRSPEFRTPEGRRKAAEILRKHRIDALVTIGGNGTLRGAHDLLEVWNGQVIGCPGTIDNDLLGTDYTIGFLTAVGTAVEAIDRIRDTAESHDMMFLIEVMGRDCGCLALWTALAGGAELVCIPETPTELPKIMDRLREMKARGKRSILMIVAEGDELGGAHEIAQKLIDAGCPFPGVRTVTLGHIQRGGSPVPEDRILASRVGDFAVKAILDGKNDVMSGVIDGHLALTPLPETYATHRPIPGGVLELLDTLSK